MLVCGGCLTESFIRIARAMELAHKEASLAMEMELKRMKEKLEELMSEYIEFVGAPEIPPFMVETPHFKMKFDIPKQTYFPKVRATARSNC